MQETIIEKALKNGIKEIIENFKIETHQNQLKEEL